MIKYIVKIRLRDNYQYTSIAGSVFGGTSMSALVMGACDVHISSGLLAVITSLSGGIFLTALAYIIDNKNGLID